MKAHQINLYWLEEWGSNRLYIVW